MGKTVKKIVSFAAPIVGGFLGGPVGAAIGGALGGVASGGGLKGALIGGGLGFAGSKLSGLFGGAAPGPAGAGAAAAAGVAPVAGGLSNVAPASLSAFGGSLPSYVAGNVGNLAGGVGSAAGGGLGGIASTIGGGITGALDKIGMTPLQATLGGVGVIQSLQNQADLEKIAAQSATLADPFQAQRGAAITAAGGVAADPRSSALYQGSLAEAEQALQRRQAASGYFFSGRGLEEAAQLPSSVLAATSTQDIANLGRIAGAAGGAPGSAANIYGEASSQAARAGSGALGAFFAPQQREDARARQNELALQRIYG